jgi:multidrug efflux pump subunit AcrB
MQKVIQWFTQNHVATNLLMIFLLIGGIILGLNLKVEIFPEVTLDKVTISVVYPGASPEEVEEGIIEPIEEAISGLSGVKQIDSTASEGVATIVVEALKGFDVNTLYDDIKSEVDRLTTLPEEAEDPVVERLTRKTQVLNLALYGNVEESFLKNQAQKIKDDLVSLPHVSLVRLSGVRDNEIHIEVDKYTLRKYNLSLTELAEKISAYSKDIPLGRIKDQAGEILLRLKGKRYTRQDFEQIPIITQKDGSVIRVKDLARVKDTFEDEDLKVRFSGLPAVLINVYRIGNQNALTVAREVKDYVEKAKNRLPQNLNLAVYDDTSLLLKGRLNLLLKNMAFGLILVSITLGLFLNLRLALWVTLGIPISFAGALIFLPVSDISINMISLFAFIMVLGIVVDDAIVIGENIYTRYQKGFSPFKASVEGTYEVGRPVIFSVLTTIAAFTPLLLGSGQMGKFMRNIPAVVNTVLVISLLEALFILPCHVFSTLKKKKLSEPKLVPRLLQKFITGPYAKTLKLCLNFRYITLTAGIVILILSIGLVKGGIIKFTFFPKVESNLLTCNLTLPPGTPASYTRKMVTRLENGLLEVIKEEDQKRPQNAPSLLKYTLSLLGRQLKTHETNVLVSQTGGNVAQIFAELLENEQRDISAEYLVKRWRQKVGEIPGAENLSFSSELFSFGKPIEIDLSAPDYQQLVNISSKLQEKLKQIPGVFDVGDSFIPGKKELQLKLKPEGLSLGLTSGYIGQEVRAAFYGQEALAFQRGKDEVKVRVIYPEKQRLTFASLEDMWLKTPMGKFVPLSFVTDFKLSESYSQIRRTNGRRVVTVFADVDETKNNSNEIRKFMEKKLLPELQQKYPDLTFNWAGEGKEQKESFHDIFQGFALSLMAIYILLAIPLRSYAQPLVIMAAIPFSILGAILGHLLLGFNLSILSMFGIVGLAGVAVNDSLVLVDAANGLKTKGLSYFEAAYLAGQNRFRAVILTSLTTFAGLMPMITEKSLQAQFLIPMAISLGFGILIATFITLLLIPCLYVIFYDIKNISTF